MLISAKLAPTFSYADLESFWLTADELGYHSVWNYDHMYGLGTEEAQHRAPTLEGWTSLAAMAKVVKRARIGCMVSAVTFRNPGLLANMAVTVDHISGGRLDFGIGAAWHEQEHTAYGVPFPGPGVRLKMLREAVTIIRSLWTQDRTDFAGEHFSAANALCEPKPLQDPHPPIVIGGGGPRLLRIVAEMADEWNGVATDPEDWARRNAILDEHCADIGRDPSSIRRSVQLFVHPAQEGQPETQLAALPEYEEAGCQHAVLSFYQPPSREIMERMAP